MANDGQIVFEVTADGKRAVADIKAITKAIQQETKQWDDAAKQSTDGIAGQFSSMLKKLAAGFSAVKIGKALLDLGRDAISAASDLEEVQNVVDVTFGSNANQIEKWAKNAGAQFGLTETQAKKFSSTMGAMLKSSGLAGDKIVDVSTDLAGLAADMASFYNLDFESAFAKIRSGISGETMPLKELGIDMSVATLNAFALKQGLDKTFDEMDQGEKTMLRYQYLMQATADAQGDFARTSDGYANSMRKLETNLESLKATLGTTFIDVVGNAVGALNGFLELLMPEEKQTTVLDDFADIDLKTEEKLEQIRNTAAEARLLTEELDKIGGAESNKAGSKVQQLVNDLANVNLDQNKAGVVKDFITTLSDNIDTLAGIQGTDADGAKAWLEGIAKSASTLKEDDVAGWLSLLDEIKEGLPGIENTDFGSAFFAALGGEMGDVSKQASVFEWAVDTLGNKTNKTAQEQAYWLEVCQRLVKTIPGLSSIINTETGEVKGGTQAVKDYIKAWEDGQTRLALLGALEQKESALASRFSDLPGLQLDMAVAERRVRKSYDQLKGIYKKYGMELQTDAEGYVLNTNFFGMDEEDIQYLLKEIDYYEALLDSAIEARNTYETQAKALDEAQQALIEYRQTIEETTGSIEDNENAVKEWSAEQKENAQKIVDAANEATTALADHVKGVMDATRASIDSTVKGFEFIGNAATRQQKRLEPLNKELEQLQAEGKDLGDINVRIADEKDVYGAGNALKGLRSQLEFLQEYKADMEAAQAAGFSNEFLAQFTDGSVESAEWLHELSQADSGTVQELNKAYEDVQKGKEELTKTLGDQQLTVDSVFESLAQKAAESVARLDLSKEAGEASGKTISAMAQEIQAHVPEVETAVTSILDQLNRLDGWGINIDLGGFGSINLTTSTGKAEGSARMGLFSVPHDDYLARLHEGERVLSAQEAQRYNTLLYGGYAGFDLDSLGGVMRDNIKPGGNVYLDGKAVGSVVSERQGKSYKSLQRSGWQA